MANKRNAVTTATLPTPAGNGNNTSPAPAPVVVTGKYAASTAKLGGAGVVPQFKYAALHLYANKAPNTAPQKPTSVMGKVYALVQANPGVTGNALVALMLAQQWVGHPSAYTAGGNVCAQWCVGYVVGACGNKHKHLVTGPAPVAGANA